jgi:hypothetical protein
VWEPWEEDRTKARLAGRGQMMPVGHGKEFGCLALFYGNRKPH